MLQHNIMNLQEKNATTSLTPAAWARLGRLEDNIETLAQWEHETRQKEEDKRARLAKHSQNKAREKALKQAMKQAQQRMSHSSRIGRVVRGNGHDHPRGLY